MHAQDTDPIVAPVRKPFSWLRHVGNTIVVGLFLSAPVILTGFVIHRLFLFVTSNLVPLPLRESRYLLLWRSAALVLVVLLLFVIGWLARYVLGRRLYRLSDRLLTRIPLINRVYVSSRQISAAIFVQRRRIFQEVVLVEYPRPGLWSLAFVTATAPQRIVAGLQEGAAAEWVSLFLPTTPNPTSGFLLLSPRAALRTVPLTVSEAMKYIVSAGMVLTGEGEGPEEDSLLKRIEEWLSLEKGVSSRTVPASMEDSA